jgi:hypothetical protein
MILNDKNLRRIKIRIEGPNRKGNNSSAQISVLDTCVEDVKQTILAATEQASNRQRIFQARLEHDANEAGENRKVGA